MRIEEIENKDKYTKFEALNYGEAFKLWCDEENADVYIKLDVDCVINLSNGMLYDSGDEWESFENADVVRMHFSKHYPRLYDSQFCNIKVGEMFVFKDVRYMKTSDDSNLYNINARKLVDNFLDDTSEVVLIPDYRIEMYEA